jgi:hypothetical protein
MPWQIKNVTFVEVANEKVVLVDVVKRIFFKSIRN